MQKIILGAAKGVGTSIAVHHVLAKAAPSIPGVGTMSQPTMLGLTALADVGMIWATRKFMGNDAAIGAAAHAAAGWWNVVKARTGL